MEALAQLAGFLFSKSLAAWAAGRKVSPTLVLEGPSGREVMAYDDDDVMAAIREARSALRQKILTAQRAALMVPEVDGESTAAVTFETADFSEPGRELTLSLKRTSTSGAPLRLAALTFPAEKGMSESEQSKLRAAFERGVKEDAEAARAWTAAHTS